MVLMPCLLAKAVGVVAPVGSVMSSLEVSVTRRAPGRPSFWSSAAMNR